MSAKIPSDQFLLYAFDGVPDIERSVTEVLARAAQCPELLMRVADDGGWRYPQWVRAEIDDESVRTHDAPSWAGCQEALVALAVDQLEPAQRDWRLHIFFGVADVPGASGPATVAALQMTHALADGGRSSAMAARLFGRDEPVPAVQPRPWRPLPVLAWQAAWAHRELVRDTASGAVAQPAPPWPVQRTNDRPSGPIALRTIVRPREQLPGPTVTVGVLAAVAESLADQLGVTDLGAEVPMAKPGVRYANNHFGNVSVALHSALPFEQRAVRIAADLAARRLRNAHHSMAVSDAASAAVPAPILRWGVSLFDTDARSETVAGNTVVTSVNRGAADLRFGACPVLFTVGFPALSPMMGLTHGVYGIGDTVVVSVHAAASALPDVDDYVQRLAAALDR